MANDSWKPLGQSKGVAILKMFGDTYIEAMKQVVENMKRNVMNMSQLGTELGKRALEADPNQYQQAADGGNEFFSRIEKKETLINADPEFKKRFDDVKAAAEAALKKV